MTKFLVQVVLVMSLSMFGLGCDDDSTYTGHIPGMDDPGVGEMGCETIHECPDCDVESCWSADGMTCWYMAGETRFGDFSCLNVDAQMQANGDAMEHCGCD